MDKFEAARDAQREASKRKYAARKDYVISEPTELIQALWPTSTRTADQRKFYYLLGVLTRQGRDMPPSMRPEGALQLVSQTLDTVEELSELIESAVENYIEEGHGD